MKIKNVLMICLVAAAVQQAYPGTVASSATEVCPVLNGMDFPEVEMQAVDGSAVRFPEAFASKPTVLVYYRGGWCPFCVRHLGAIYNAEAEIRSLGYQLVAVSADSPETLQKSEVQEHEHIQFYSDSTMKAASELGIAFTLDEPTLHKLDSYNIDVEAASGETHHILPVPAVLVIDGEGVVTFSYINPNYKVRLDPEVLLAALRSQAGN